jgi:hypothetical protein
MKAYAVHSWGDTEYFLSKKKATERRDRIDRAESKIPELRSRKLRPKVYKIEINEAR